MFKRIKNLLDISKYTVDELKNPPKEQEAITTSGFTTFNPVTIVDLKTTNPFDEYETTEFSPNDTTPRNG